MVSLTGIICLTPHHHVRPQTSYAPSYWMRVDIGALMALMATASNI
jgi:hypothetical protein